MRILWLGNPPWAPSGYGEQAALFLPRFQEQGHEVAVLCNWGMHGQASEWNGIPCYPCDGLWGQRNLPVYADRLRADLIVGLFDAWVVNPDVWPEGLKLGLWTPVDHDMVPPAVGKVLANERVTPVAMSRFGEQLMRDAGLEPLYVPHGVDTGVFRPMPEIRDEARDGLGLPRDAFVVGMVAANVSTMPCRKAFPEALQAFARFAETHEDAWLYMHTDFQPQGCGVNLNPVADWARCPQRIRYPDPASLQLGIPREVVACTYQAFDCLLHCSMGEGFGLAGLEANACGVPVITSDHSAMSELCGPGWLVGGQPFWDEHQKAGYIIPSIDGIVDALEDAYRGDRRRSVDAVAFAAQYDADTVADEYWKPVLAVLSGRERETVAA